MDKLEQIQRLVKELYESNQPGRDEIADWIYEHHVVVTAAYAADLTGEFGGDADFAVAGALMHDIGDAVMSRFADDFDEKSYAIAKEFMTKAGYTPDEQDFMIEEVIKPHSCHKGDRQPTDVNGKILATADAMAHLCTDAYLYWCWSHMFRSLTLADYKASALKKLERDFNDKIQWDEVRERVRPDCDALVRVFSK